MPIQVALMPLQIEVVNCDYRFLGLFAGRRFGKTHCIRARIVRKCLKKRNQEIIYITPLSAQAREVYRAMILDPDIRHLITYKSERPYPEITFVTGSRVKFRSMQRPDGIKSTGEDEIICDEIQSPAYKEEDVDCILMPMISDKRGTFMVSGQFRGWNWFHKRFFLPGQSQWKLDIEGRPLIGVVNSLYKSWRIPSSSGLKFQGTSGAEELDMWRASIPKAVWDQEWDCVPTANFRAVFETTHLEWAAQNAALPHTKPESGWKYIIGLDLGGRFDYSALVVLAWNEKTKFGHVCETVKFPLRTPHAEQSRRVELIRQKWNAAVIADNTGGATGGHGQQDEIFKFYRDSVRDMREFTFSMKTKAVMIRNMSLQLEQHRITIPRQFGELHTQLAEYEWELKGGIYRYAAPDGKHDDFTVACGLAIEGGLRGWAGGSNNATALSQVLY